MLYVNQNLEMMEALKRKSVRFWWKSVDLCGESHAVGSRATIWLLEIFSKIHRKFPFEDYMIHAALSSIQLTEIISCSLIE